MRIEPHRGADRRAPRARGRAAGSTSCGRRSSSRRRTSRSSATAAGCPTPVHAALAALEGACAGADPAWSEVSHAHAALHGAIVAASESPRIVAAHAALTGELLLFLLQLQPHVEAGRLAADHAALVAALEREGAGVLRAHLRESAETLGARRRP